MANKEKEDRLIRQKKALEDKARDKEIRFKKLLCHGYNIKSSSREYKPLRLPVLHLKEKKKEWMADIAAWAKAEATVFKYGPILPDIVRMISVFKVKEGIFMAPRNSDDVDMVVRDDYLEAARELYKELDIDTKKTGRSDCGAAMKGGLAVMGINRSTG